VDLEKVEDGTYDVCSSVRVFVLEPLVEGDNVVE